LSTRAWTSLSPPCAVIARFPFDSEGTEPTRETEEPEDEWARADRLDDEQTQAAEELVETLRGIDPAAVVDQNGFWKIFVADVQMGDFTTSDVLGSLLGTDE
jgi:hypothetical protein